MDVVSDDTVATNKPAGGFNITGNVVGFSGLGASAMKTVHLAGIQSGVHDAYHYGTKLDFSGYRTWSKAGKKLGYLGPAINAGDIAANGPNVS